MAPDHSNDPTAEDALSDQEMAEFDALLDQHLPHSAPTSTGEIFEVTVVSVREDGVLVDTGGKAEALIPLEDFVRINDKVLIDTGDRVPVVQVGTTSDGSPRLSHREARTRRAVELIQKSRDEQSPITGRVTAVVKGGVMVDIGLPAFMPASQIDLFKVPDLNSLVGQEVESYISEYDPRRRRAVISRRLLLVERRENERKSKMTALTVGQRVVGKVKSALEFGVFVELGGIDGFIPREEVSFDRGTPPSRILKAGDSVEVEVVAVDAEKGKITLSRKRTMHDPWDAASGKYAVGNIVTGRAISVQSYGAFVHLEEGVTGMIHASDMSWTPGNKVPADYVKEGEEITAQIIEVDAEKRRISLGLKQITQNPWEEVEAKYPAGTNIKGIITSLTSYGAFVKIDDYIEGMIHVSDIVWDRRLNHPKEVLKVGEAIEAVVLKADPKTRRLSLGMKQIAPSPYENYQKDHPAGSIVTGKVSRFAPFGAFVELAAGLEGLIHISQIDTKRVELPEKALELGQEVTVKVLKYDPKSQKISLSRKDAMRSAQREEIRQYTAKAKGEPQSFNSFGDALRQAQEETSSPD